MKKSLIVLSLACGLSAPAWAQTNLIVNAGFESVTVVSGGEDDFSDWTEYLSNSSPAFQQSVKADTVEKYAGTYAVRLGDNHATQSCSIETAASIAVVTTASYELSFLAKVVSGAPRVVVEFLDDSGGVLERVGTAVAGNSSVWQANRVRIGPNGSGTDIFWAPETSAVKFYFYPSGDPSSENVGEVYLDEVDFHLGGPVRNGGFEADFDSWSVNNNGSPGQTISIDTSVLHSGLKGAHLVDASTSQGSTIRQRFPVNNGQAFQISFWGYLVSGNPRLQIRQLDAAGVELNKHFVHLSGSAWNHYYRVMTPDGLGGDFIWDTSTTQVELSFSAAIQTTTGEAYYDDVSATPVNLYDNPGFESASASPFRGWVLTGAKGNGIYTDVVAGDAPSGGGVNSLLVGDQSRSIAGNFLTSVDIDPSETYAFSFYYKNPLNAAAVTIRQFERGPGVNRVAVGTSTYTITLPVSATWQQHTMTIGPGGDIVPDTTTDSLRFNFYAKSASLVDRGEAQYDSVALLDAASANLIPTGHFEGGLGRWTLPVNWVNVAIEPSTTAGEMRGTRAARLTDLSSEGFAALHQEARILPSGSYALSFYAKILSEGGYVYVRQLDRDRKTLATSRIDLSGSGWQLYTRTLATSGADIALDADVRYLLLICYAGEEFATTHTGEVIYDDVLLFPRTADGEWTANPSSPPVLNSDGAYVRDPRSVWGDAFDSASLSSSWTSSGAGISSASYFSAPYSVELSGNGLLSAGLNLSGYEDVALAYQSRVDVVAGGDVFASEYSINDGSSWNGVESITADQSWSETVSALTADNAPQFRFRFTTDLDPAAKAWVDDLEIWATPTAQNYLFPPQPLGGYTIASTLLPAQPSWLSEHLTHIHTLININTIGNIDPADVVDAVAATGAHAMVAHIHSGDEGLWYPTGVSEAVQDPDLVGRDVVEEYLEAIHPLGDSMRLIGYRWMHSDRNALVRHPEWAARNASAELVPTPRGFKLSLASGYRDYLRALLVEAAGKAYSGRKLDGFFFDVFEMAVLEGDFNPNALDRYVAAFGYPLPTSNSYFDPLSRKLVMMSDIIIQEAWQEISEALLAVNPNLAIIAANNPDLGASDTIQNTPEMGRRVSAIKSEIKLNRHSAKAPSSSDVGLSKPRQPVEFALDSLLYRDAARKLPYYWNPPRDDADTEPDFLNTLVGLTVTNGAIIDLHTIHATGSTLHGTPSAEYAAAINYGVAREPYTKGASYLTWAVVHYSEREHEARGLSLSYDWSAEEWTSQDWGEFFWPMFGPLQTLMQAHVPLGVITDSAIAEGRFDNIKVVIIPHPDNLTPAENAALSSFVLGGGVVIKQMNNGSGMVDLDDPSLAWHDPSAQSSLFSDLWSEIVSAAGEPPIQVEAPAHTQAGFFRNSDGKLVVSLLNDSNWIDFQNEGFEPDLMDTPPASFDATIILRQGNPTSAMEQPASSSLSIGLVAGEHTIEVDDIDLHTLVVIEGI